MAYDPTSKIRAFQTAWKQASARGDNTGMESAHAGAEAARASAGWGSGGVTGAGTESRMSDRPRISGGGSSSGSSSAKTAVPATSSYQQYLTNYFGGNPEAYAAEIQKKEAAGTGLTDQVAADTLKRTIPVCSAARSIRPRRLKLHLKQRRIRIIPYGQAKWDTPTRKPLAI